MSSQLPVAFFDEADRHVDAVYFQKPRVIIPEASDLGSRLRSGAKRFSDFTFSTLFSQNFPLRFDVLQLFQNWLPQGGPSATELELCDRLQSLVDNCKSNRAFRKMCSLVQEFYFLTDKRLTGKGAVYHNATVRLSGRDFSTNNCKTVDLAVDGVDTSLTIELGECALSVRAFQTSDKGMQLRFYSDILSSIRELARTRGLAALNLRLELIGAWAPPGANVDLPPDLRRVLAVTNVMVVVVTPNRSWIVSLS